MKKRILKSVEEIVEVNLEDVAQEIVDAYSISDFADATREDCFIDYVNDYLDYHDIEISDSEKETLKNLVISKVTPTIETLKKKELKTISNREKILELLERWLCVSEAFYDYQTLSTSEILDEIIKNGNK